jgi:hypothetical protein
LLFAKRASPPENSRLYEAVVANSQIIRMSTISPGIDLGSSAGSEFYDMEIKEIF